jgi:hypothetical protein
MGYACPVCETPQADAGHLANHLAITAITHGDDHESWLDDNVPEWETYGEDELGERVGDLADEAEYPQVFEESGIPDENDGELPVDAQAARDRSPGQLDDDAKEVLDRARELTERMYAGGSEDGDATDEE